MNYKNKKVLVCGMGKSGIAAARLLNSHGAIVTLQDLKDKENYEDWQNLENEGITLYTGKNPDDILTEQELMVLSPGIPTDLPFIVRSENELHMEVISEVELAFRKLLCPMIAITGTDGKTTTTTLVGEIMKEVYKNTAVVGNIGISFSEKVEELKKDDFAVAELSSFQLEKIKTFRPHVSAVLNISPDHLNRHKTMENYIAMKERIFENQLESDHCILNYEDTVCREMANKTKARVVFFSSKQTMSDGVFLENDAIYFAKDGVKTLVLPTKELQILGVHNYENVMAAVAMTLAVGVDLSIIQKVLRKFSGVAHRIEYVGAVHGVNYYNDSKGTNVDAAIRGILAMERPTILIGGGYDKGGSYDEWTSLFVGRVKRLILIGETANAIAKSATENGFTEITFCDTLQDAVAIAKKESVNGDAVLLSPACASWGMFDNYEQRGDVFKMCVRSN